MSEESRRHLRVFRHSPMTFATSAGSSAEGQLLDMSLGGLRFQSQQRLEQGDRVTSDIVLPGGRHFLIEGTIIYRRESTPYTYGLSFTADVQEKLVSIELGNL